MSSLREIPCYCALCVSQCGSIAVVDGTRFVSLEPDPSHPTGQALCAKGRAAPEISYSPRRLMYPMKRTRPKGDADPGWTRISWDEALSTTAETLRNVAAAHGSECVVFSAASPSTSALSDTTDWIERLMNAFGSPNLLASVELCGWGRYFATTYTFGASVPGVFMPDIDNAGCILFWGYNPSVARLAHATATLRALKRGARLIAVDPRQAGLASKADAWLQVRPGTDGALALAIAHVMIERGWYDAAFVREWTNGPLLVRLDNGRLLREVDLDPAGSTERYVAWDAAGSRAVMYDAASGRYDGDTSTFALSGAMTIDTNESSIECRPAFALVADACGACAPEFAEEICGVSREDIERAARMMWESRPLAYYAWSGVEQQSGATNIARAIAQLCVLTGSFDVPGGNVQFASVPGGDITGRELMSRTLMQRSLGFTQRPLGPARWGFATTDEVYRAILDRTPYEIRAMIGFGANLLMAHADSARGRDALAALDFYVHADVFMNPTAELADIVLPVAGAFEREALRMGFGISTEAQSLVQLRARVIEPPGEARSDTQIVFDLASRLGLGEHFWNGDLDAAYRHQLDPSGISLEELRAKPEGVRVPLTTRHRKYAEIVDGRVRGFATPTRKVELYSEQLHAEGYDPLPRYAPPLVGHVARPDLARRFPLVLTTAKPSLFCESQHRGIPSLRRRSLDPSVELHPSAAASRDIAAGDWVSIETQMGSVRARARFNDSLAPDVVCGQHGWWESCDEIGAPGYDPFSSDGANLNLIIGNDAIDPVSGSVPHRAYVCEIRPVQQ